VQKFHDQFEDVLAGPGMHCNDTQESMRPVLFSFTKDPEIPLTQIQSKMIRIIFGLFYEDKVLVVMCYAKHMQLTNQNHLWIIPAWYADGWWKRADTFDWSPYKYECNSSDIMEAIEGSLLLDVYPYLLDDTTVSESNYTINSFDAEYTRRRDQYFNITNTTDPSTIPNKLYTTLIYDALWSLAISLNRTDNHLQSFNISLRNFTYSDSVNNQPTLSSNISNLIADNLHKTDFVGVSGRVKFDVNGTRRGVIGIWQYGRSSCPY
jgi:gamma-aminobutyric acid type B receptor